MMEKTLLAINSGSSSVKVSVFKTAYQQPPQHVADAQIGGLSAPPPTITYTRGDVLVKNTETVNQLISDQRAAFRFLLCTLIEDPDLHLITGPDDICMACHRVVHGGDYTISQVITQDTLHHLEALSDLAPLHNGAALNIVRACLEQLPGASNIACFDSQFHSTIPEHIRSYPINQDVARKNRLRKYGFHGISYSYILRVAAIFLGKEVLDMNLIALHLGSGASACAIKKGQSWDTSMGLTPLAGLPGATRSGNVDPSLVFHYASNVGKLSPSSTTQLHISRAEEILNNDCGWKSLAGTADFGVIAAGADPGHRLAFDIFVDRVCGFIGNYYVALDGQVDALVFSGGIGENSSKLRERVTSQVSCLGFEVSPELNSGTTGPVVREVSPIGAARKVLVCQTDEQFEMARGCAADERLWQSTFELRL